MTAEDVDGLVGKPLPRLIERLLPGKNLGPGDLARSPIRFGDGSKLSKQTHAPAVDNARAANNLRDVLSLLGQNPPAEPAWSISQWLSWGVANWQVEKVPQTLANFTRKP